jgi:hypothetical protein
MIENMNNMEDIMTNIYDSFNVLTNRPIIMVDNATIFTYGSILITTTILAVATIYDEGVDDDDEDVDDDDEPNNTSNQMSDSTNEMRPSTNEISPSTNEISPSTNEISPSTNEMEEDEDDKEETNQNVGGKKHKKRKRTIKKHNKRKN